MRLHVEIRFAPCSQTRRRAVRDGLSTIEQGQLVRESVAPAAWGKGSRGAPLRIGHDGPIIGRVTNILDHGQWHVADAMIDLADTDPLCQQVREHVKVGARVSPAFDAIDEERNQTSPDHPAVVRYTKAHLDEIAILEHADDIPGYVGARISRVRELEEREPAKPKRSATIHVPDEALGRDVEPGEVIADTGRPIRRTGLARIIGIR